MSMLPKAIDVVTNDIDKPFFANSSFFCNA